MVLKMRCVQVEKKDAEKTKQTLIKLNVLAINYRPLSGKKYIYFAVTKPVSGYTIVNKTIPAIQRIHIDAASFDQVGDIVILGEDGTKKQAEQLLQMKTVKVVLRRKGIHGGEFRTQDLEWIAGEKRKETSYKENGVQIKVDVEKCYFSPRLSTERLRIANQVEPGEKVLIMFSGVAPYCLVIARHSKAAKIVGVEKNPIAHKYALENCRKMKNIELFNSDVHGFIYPEKFDRIAMPLPYSAEEFLDDALRLAKKGATIHFYDFVEEADIPQKSIDEIKRHCANAKVFNVVKCGQYGPKRWRICVDFTKEE